MQTHRTAIAGFIAATLLFASPGAGADDRSMTVNDSFFDGVPVAPDTEILLVAVDPKVLPHGEADAELIQYPTPDSARLPNSCGLDLTPPVPFTLDCGAKMLALETNGNESVYYFLLKTRRKDWYEVVLSPQSGKTIWVKDRHIPGMDMAPHALVDWLQSGDSYVLAHEMVDPFQSMPVMSKPDDRSEVLTDCAGYADGEGLVQMSKIPNGEWMRATCLENDCYATNDPERACTPLRDVQEIPCAQGWVRWRGQNGHLMLYPHHALSEGC